MTTPYHLGFDCDGWKAHQAKPKCTYCGGAAEETGTVKQTDVCRANILLAFWPT